MEAEKAEKGKGTANINKAGSGKRLNKKKNLTLNVIGEHVSDLTKKQPRFFAYRGGVCGSYLLREITTGKGR
jgi:hypothetical protein